MAVGHMKFSPDYGFGLVRTKQKLVDLYTIGDVKKMIDESTPDTSRNRAFECPDDMFRDWKHFTERGNVRFRKLLGIKPKPIYEIQIFRCDEDVMATSPILHDGRAVEF